MLLLVVGGGGAAGAVLVESLLSLGGELAVVGLLLEGGGMALGKPAGLEGFF